RDFTYIDDCVSGILAALDTPALRDDQGVSHRVYNLGNDSPEELMTLIALIEKHAGQEAEKNFEPMQPGDVERTWANIDRARTELGYNPGTSLDEGLGHFVDWFRQWRVR
ncbi:MAG: GDP-mannose 4,6-dehydratase, partial [Pseudomonadota bacterium]